MAGEGGESRVILPPPSQELVAHGFSSRVVPPDGEPGRPLIIGEAPGKREDDDLIPFHPEADAGGLFKRLMERVGVKRDRFTIWNCVNQRPPGNELYDDKSNPKWYTAEAIEYWKPFLHQFIEEMQPPVIIGLGRTALEVLTGFQDIGTTRGYVNMARIALPDNVPCECAVASGIAHPHCFLCGGSGVTDGWDKRDLHIPTICTYHPQFLNYGNRHLSGVFIRDVLEGLDIGAKGWHPPQAKINPTPSPDEFRWFCAQYNPERHILTYDIENPETRGVSEEELESEIGKKEISYEIDRMSFCFDTAIGGWSIPYTEPFTSMAKGLLASLGTKRGHNCRLHDRPRLTHNGFVVRGREEDTLELWRHLHRTLPASVAFIVPFYVNISPWKHEAHTQPEYYSACDAYWQHVMGEGIERDLRNTGQWEMAQRHVVDVLSLAEKMSQNGLPYDSTKAKEFEKELEGKQAERMGRLQELVPDDLKPVKQKEGLKKEPKELREARQIALDEFDSDLSKEQELQVLCKAGYIQRDFTIWEKSDTGATLPKKVTRWAKLLPFNPDSPPQKLRLIHYFGHKPKTDRKTKKETTGDATMRALVAQCLKSKQEKDQVALECYKLIRECVAIATALGFVRGWKPGLDGCLHATPGLWGDMFRLSWRRPPLSATPADKKEIQIAAGFRKCICVPDDQVIIEADWQSQEAVILGWYAKDESYIRLARLSLNAYMTSHLLNRPADLSWSDADLGDYLRQIKNDKLNIKVYDDAKHCIYLIQNGGTPYLISETYDMSIERASYLYSFYFDLFPQIKALHKRILEEAHEKARLVNPWGYRMPIWSAYQWEQKRYDRLRKLWVKWKTNIGDRGGRFSTREMKDIKRIEVMLESNTESDQAIRSLCYDLGTEAKAALSFYPRDTGSAMLKDALLAMEEEHRLVSRGFLRATAHDSVVALAPRRDLDEVAQAMKTIMERPQKPLGGLVVGVDVSLGQSWDKRTLSAWRQVEVAAGVAL